MQRVNPFLELLKLFSQAPDCRGLWTNCFQGGKGKWSEWLVASAAFLPRCLCCCSAPGSRSCHISVDSSQAESSVLTSYFLGVRWKFLKNRSRRQKDTSLPTYHTQSVRGETRRDYRMFPICFREKERAKENWNALVKPDTPRFSGQHQNGSDIWKGCLLFQEFVWKLGVAVLQ